MAEQKQDTGQVNFKEIQTRLDNKLIDPRQLNRAQKGALDLAFKEGKLKGYGSVSEMDAERQYARIQIAKEFKEKLAPLTPTSALSIGIKRGTLVAAGDIFGSFAPYIQDGKKLSAEARELALKGKGVSYIPEIQRTTGKNTFTAVSNLLTKLPVFKNLKLFQKTAKVLDDFVGTIGAGSTAKLVASQALTTELKSQALGAAGAGAGSIAYDVINFPAKFVAGANDDMAKIDENQYNKMGKLEKMTYHAIDNAKTALMWNAGSFGIFAAFSGVPLAVKKFFKLNPQNLEKLNKQIIEQGLPINLIQYSEGSSGASKILRGINPVISVVPVAGGEPIRAQQKATAVALTGLAGNLRDMLNVPFLHAEVLAKQVNGTIRDAYEKSGNIYGTLYKQSEDAYDATSNVLQKYKDEIVDKYRGVPAAGRTFTDSDEKIIGALFPEGTAIPFIYMNNLKTTTDRLSQELKKGLTDETIFRMRQQGLRSDAADPLNQFIFEIQARLGEYSKMNGGNYLTPSQFNQLRRDWNSNWTNTFQKSAEPVQNKVGQIQEAMEKDFNGVVKNPNAKTLPEFNPRLAKFYTTVEKELGKGKADQFLKEFQNKVADADQHLRDANYNFMQSINFYNNEKLSGLMRKVDSNELTVRKILNVQGKNNLNDVQGMNALFKAAFDSDYGTSQGVRQLYELLGGAKRFDKPTQERARYTLGLLMYNKFFDAMNKNAIIRTTKGVKGGAEEGEPFVRQGLDMNDIFRMLDEKSPEFKYTINEMIKKDSRLGKVSDQYMDRVKYYEKALTPDIIEKAIKDKLPITQEIFIKKEVDALGPRVKPFPKNVVETQEKALQAMVGGRIVSKAERKEANEQIEEIHLRLSGYEGFKFEPFQRALGLTTKEGRSQLIEGFKIAKGLSDTAAVKHIDNIETIIEYLKKDYYTPKGDSAAYVTRKAIFALGAGAGIVGAAGLSGGIGSIILSAIFLKAGARFLNSPSMAAKWLDMYTTGQRIDINMTKSMDQSRQQTYADIFNYAFADDPDAPKINPANIDNAEVIKYLQGQTVQPYVSQEGLYQAVPQRVKEMFNPDLKKLRELSLEQLQDINSFNQGRAVADTRTDILDGLANQQNTRNIPENLQGFLENPSAIEVPEGLKQASAQAQANISAQTQAVYDSLFPQDKLGSAIAGSQNA
jgi:hypothetical protein